jgi:hypothetical protein
MSGIGKIVEDHVRAASRELFCVEEQLARLADVIGAARADGLRRRAYALRVSLQDIGDAARMEINGAQVRRTTGEEGMKIQANEQTKNGVRGVMLTGWEGDDTTAKRECAFSQWLTRGEAADLAADLIAPEALLPNGDASPKEGG